MQVLGIRNRKKAERYAREAAEKAKLNPKKKKEVKKAKKIRSKPKTEDQKRKAKCKT